MGDLLVLAGQRYNVLETGTVTVTSEDPLYPKSRLWEARPIQPYKSTGTVDQIFDVDGNRVPNGNLDSWSAGAPTGWTVSGTVTQEATIVRSGSAVRVNGGSFVQVNFLARAGERVNLNGWRRITATGQGVAVATLTNLATGRSWVGGSWADGVSEFLSDSTNTSYTQYGPTVVDVEPYSVVGADTCTLRLRLENTDATATDYVYFDDWYLWPSIDFFGVFGNNIGASISVDVFRGATFPPTTGEGNLPLARPSFFGWAPSPFNDRYLRLKMTGDNIVPYIIGDIILGKALALSRKMSDAGYEMQEVYDVIETMSEAGDHQAVSRSDHPRQILGCEFDYTSHAEKDESRDEVFRRSLGSARPVVVAPDSSRPDVILGKLDRSFKVRRLLETLYSERALIVDGLPFPLVTA